MSGEKIRAVTPTVAQIGRMHFEGNVTPHSWFEHIRIETKGGKTKPDLVAITILSDLVYWHRPMEYRDEETNQVIGYGRKFWGEKLQRHNGGYEESFGLTKRQVKDAMLRLERLGLIKRSWETIRTSTGMACANVQFIDLVPEAIAAITYSKIKANRGYDEKTSEGRSFSVAGVAGSRRTYTENTSENSSQNSSEEREGADAALSLNDDGGENHEEHGLGSGETHAEAKLESVNVPTPASSSVTAAAGSEARFRDDEVGKVCEAATDDQAKAPGALTPASGRQLQTGVNETQKGAALENSSQLRAQQYIDTDKGCRITNPDAIGLSGQAARLFNLLEEVTRTPVMPSRRKVNIDALSFLLEAAGESPANLEKALRWEADRFKKQNKTLTVDWRRVAEDMPAWRNNGGGSSFNDGAIVMDFTKL